MRTGSAPTIWWFRCARALGLLMWCLVLTTTVHAHAAQIQPPPRPETLPTFYDPSQLIVDEVELRTLNRDARLLQSTQIPTLVYVRVVSADDAEPATARSYANAVRHAWGVETAPGADDGLVLLLSYTPWQPEASSVVASWGASTFDRNGLTPEYIDAVLSKDVRSLLDQGNPSEALVYGMRQIRYGGIYFPPPPPQLEGPARLIHNALEWGGPATALVTLAGFIVLSIRERSRSYGSHWLVWGVAGVTLAIITGLAVLSVFAQSRIGIGSALIILVALAIRTSLWSRSPRRNRRDVRHVRVRFASRRRSVQAATRSVKQSMAEAR